MDLKIQQKHVLYLILEYFQPKVVRNEYLDIFFHLYTFQQSFLPIMVIITKQDYWDKLVEFKTATQINTQSNYAQMNIHLPIVFLICQQVQFQTNHYLFIYQSQHNLQLLLILPIIFISIFNLLVLHELLIVVYYVLLILLNFALFFLCLLNYICNMYYRIFLQLLLTQYFTIQKQGIENNIIYVHSSKKQKIMMIKIEIIRLIQISYLIIVKIQAFISYEQLQHSYMKKKTDKTSYKKIAQPNKREQIKMNNDSVIYDKKKSIKTKSTQKTVFHPDLSQKFKIGPKNGFGHTRIKTEVDEVPQRPKVNYNTFLNQQKFDKVKPMINLYQTKRSQRNYHQRNITQAQQKNKNIKKLRLNHQLLNIIKQGSLDKYDGPLSGKYVYQSFRRPHDSHRSAIKKTVLQDYVSGSLENLRRKKSQVSSRSGGQRALIRKTNQNGSLQKQTKLKNMLLRPQQDTATQYLKDNKKLIDIQDLDQSNDAQEKTKVKQVKRQSRFQKHEMHRKIYTQKDQSLEKFQIKFQKANKYDLSRQQQDMFGDRFPDGFQKVKLLGRGGFSLVWLGQHKKSKKRYAVKQIITQSNHQTHIKQIWFGTYFFEFGGAPKAQFANHPGINNLVKLYYYFINKKDTWILYQKCGDSLGNALYDLKGQRVNSQKMYRIHHKPLYDRIRRNQNQLRKILLQVAKALQLLADNNIIHSDLKTENILIRQKTQQQLIKNESDPSCIAEVKLIDYGSSFVFNNLRQFSMATPEYMAPEILNFILYENQMEYIQKLLDYVQKYNRPWVIDMWSLGCVLLQIVSGIPLWMSLKTIVTKVGQPKQHIRYGLFAVKGRLFDKIIRKQIQVIQNLDHYLEVQNFSGIKLQPDLRGLLKRMLSLNPEKRISPGQVIQFLQQSLQEGTNINVDSSSDEKQTINR